MENIPIPVPSLSPAGWVTDVATKADILMAWFFESIKSQTYIYGSNVSNLQWLIEEYGSNTMTLTSQISSTLEIYLGRYFDFVSATVTADDTPSNLNGSITITIHCLITDNGIQYSLGKLLQVSDSTVIDIININNG